MRHSTNIWVPIFWQLPVMAGAYKTRINVVVICCCNFTFIFSQMGTMFWCFPNRKTNVHHPKNEDTAMLQRVLTWKTRQQLQPLGLFALIPLARPVNNTQINGPAWSPPHHKLHVLTLLALTYLPYSKRLPRIWILKCIPSSRTQGVL